jgi:hypothetical protein
MAMVKPLRHCREVHVALLLVTEQKQDVQGRLSPRQQ